MANQKSKKAGKKSSSKPETAKEVKEVKETKPAVVEQAKTTTEKKSDAKQKSSTGFFARKYDKGENILTIFKTKKIWGALIGELIGTMMISAMLLALTIFGLFQYTVYLAPALICVYIAIVGLSGANLNPLITVGMMASRRMSAIRGVLYMLAQVIGAWLGLLIVNAFRLGSTAAGVELPVMDTVEGETFVSVAMVELIGAIILAFCFARGLRYARRSALTFAFAISSAMIFVIVFGALISQGFFQYAVSFVFNPAIALMYQILPTSAAGFGELAGLMGLALATYVIIPMVGGVLGFYISDIASRFVANGYFCDFDDQDKIAE